jgi:hypothetical protein
MGYDLFIFKGNGANIGTGLIGFLDFQDHRNRIYLILRFLRSICGSWI